MMNPLYAFGAASKKKFNIAIIWRMSLLLLHFVLLCVEFEVNLYDAVAFKKKCLLPSDGKMAHVT